VSFNGSSHPILVDTEEREKREEENAGAENALKNQKKIGRVPPICAYRVTIYHHVTGWPVPALLQGRGSRSVAPTPQQSNEGPSVSIGMVSGGQPGQPGALQVLKTTLSSNF
jgi:hypothetical protein